MADKTLIGLILAGTILSLAHNADHIVRGDIPWMPQSLPFLVVSLAIYAIVGVALFLYWQNKVGPRFWAVVAGLGAILRWFGHLSPFTDQPPQYICSAYGSVAAGWLAVACLAALMLPRPFTRPIFGADRLQWRNRPSTSSPSSS